MDGTWERILGAVLAEADADADIGWTVSVDSTVCPGPPARCRCQEKGAPDRAEPDDHALGRSRGGLSRSAHRHSCSAKRTRKAKDPPRPRPGGPRVLITRDPNSPPPTRDPRCHPPAVRPVGHRLRRGSAGGRLMAGPPAAVRCWMISVLRCAPVRPDWVRRCGRSRPARAGRAAMRRGGRLRRDDATPCPVRCDRC